MNESRGSLSATAEATPPPFDSARLDGLLDEAGIDAVVISSKHNIHIFRRLPVFLLRSFRRDWRQPLFAVSRLCQRASGSIDLYRARDGCLREGAWEILDPVFPDLGTSLDLAQLVVDHLKSLPRM